MRRTVRVLSKEKIIECREDKSTWVSLRRFSLTPTESIAWYVIHCFIFNHSFLAWGTYKYGIWNSFNLLLILVVLAFCSKLLVLILWLMIYDHWSLLLFMCIYVDCFSKDLLIVFWSNFLYHSFHFLWYYKIDIFSQSYLTVLEHLSKCFWVNQVLIVLHLYLSDMVFFMCITKSRRNEL